VGPLLLSIFLKDNGDSNQKGGRWRGKGENRVEPGTNTPRTIDGSFL